MIKINFASDTNIGKVRTNNEDYHLPGSTKNGDLFIVCDGMGGHAAGEVASQLAAKSIFEYLNSNLYEDIVSAIKDAINYANQQVFQYSQNHPETQGMGTTLVMALIKDDDIYIAHVGDSRAYYVSDKKIYFITKDHSLVQSLVDAGIITEQQATTDSRKNQITQAIGIEPNLKIDINIVHPKKGDQILLSTDGLTDLVDPIKVNEILNFEIPEKEKITLLINEALKKGGKDNITMILLNIQDSPYSVAEFNDFTPKMILEAQGIGEPQESLETTQQISNIEEYKNKFIELLKNKYVIGALSVVILAVILFFIFKPKQPEYHFLLIPKEKPISKKEAEEFIKKQNPVDFEIRCKKCKDSVINIKNQESIETTIKGIIEQTPSNLIMDFYLTSKDKKDTIMAIIVYSDKYKNYKSFVDSVKNVMIKQANVPKQDTTTDKLIPPKNTTNRVSPKNTPKKKVTDTTNNNVNNTPKKKVTDTTNNNVNDTPKKKVTDTTNNNVNNTPKKKVTDTIKNNQNDTIKNK